MVKILIFNQYSRIRIFIITYDTTERRRKYMILRKNAIVGAGLAIAAVLLIAIVFAAITATKTVPSSGTIAGVNLKLFEDDGITALTEVNWGTSLENDTAYPYDIFVNNTGTVPMTLSMTTNSWIGTNSTRAVTLTWNRGGQTVAAGGRLLATLTLTVENGYTEGCSFTMNIVINGTQV